MALSNFNGILLSDLTAFDGISSISAINGISATIGSDVTAPTLISATVAANGTTLTLVFSEAVSQGVGYSDADLNLDASTTGTDLGLTYVSGDGTNTWVYTSASTIQSGETVDLDFNGDADSIEDGAGNDLAAIVSGAVTNNSTQGGPAYYYTPGIDASITGTSDYQHTNPQARLGKIVLASGGTVTKLGIYIGFVNSSTAIKLALFDSSRNFITGSDVNPTISSGDNQWHDFTISKAVSSGTYYVGYSSNTSFDGALNGKYIAGSSGDSYTTSDASTYANFPGSLTGLGPETNSIALRLELTP